VGILWDMGERRICVQRAICASSGTIFEVLASPAGHVSIDASGMLMSAGGDPVSAVGDRFTVQMDRESLQDFPLGEYEVEVVITRFEVDRAIAWGIESVNLQPPIGHVYGYDLEPIDGGTLVTLTYDWTDVHPDWEAAVDVIFPVVSETNLRATLGILARTVAPGLGRPGAGED
jgi:hypothetical protein